MDDCISLQNIKHCFGTKKVLNGISLNIGYGEIFGLLGPSGAGKTTLIKIITGQLKQTAGEAFVMGKNSTRLDREVYTQVGMVLDNSGLYERLTCYDNLELFAKIYGLGKESIDQALEAVGLAEARKRPVMKLSKGMRGRLVIARAIMHEPSIIFMDEPTSGLDPSTAAEIHSLILSQQQRGATIFLTTHNMEEAAKMCGNVALLHEGKIVEYGKPDWVCRKYNHLNRICILLKNGEEISLVNGRDSAEEIRHYLEEEMIASIHSTEPNLESVFMELTGAGLL